MNYHRHLQLNIKQTMPPEKIRADVRHAFTLIPDTIVFNECVRATHQEIHYQAHLHRYGVYIGPDHAGSQVVLAWRFDKFACEARGQTLAMRGRKNVTPHRYVKRARLRRKDTDFHLGLVGTHMVSSGWTGNHHLDAWRQRGWYAHAVVLGTILRRMFRRNDAVIWSGDCNRPPGSWKARRPFPSLTGWKDSATSQVVHTDHTHGGVTFDYVGLLSRKQTIKVVGWSTPNFHSDHDAILVNLKW